MPWLSLLIALVAVALLALGAHLGYREHRRQRQLRRERRLTPSGVQAELLRLRRRVRKDQLERDLAALGKQPRLPFAFQAHYDEDEFLFEVFDGKLAGTFIEVGAVDGVSGSVTYPFEAVGWSGVLIEPQPEHYEKCKVNRPHSAVVHAALGPTGSTGTARFTCVNDEGTSVRAGHQSYLGVDEKNARRLRGRGKVLSHIDVPLTTMDAVLEQNLARVLVNGELDFAVIDVEGGELGLLQGFDVARWKPKVLLIEDFDRPSDKAVHEHLRARGYTRAGRQRNNRAYVRTDLPELLAKVRFMTHPA